MAKSKEKPEDWRFALVQNELNKAKAASLEGDIDNAAHHAHIAARYAMNLADELRFDQGVKAGLARAAAKKKGTKDR